MKVTLLKRVRKKEVQGRREAGKKMSRDEGEEEGKKEGSNPNGIIFGGSKCRWIKGFGSKYEGISNT